MFRMHFISSLLLPKQFIALNNNRNKRPAHFAPLPMYIIILLYLDKCLNTLYCIAIQKSQCLVNIFNIYYRLQRLSGMKVHLLYPKFNHCLLSKPKNTHSNKWLVTKSVILVFPYKLYTFFCMNGKINKILLIFYFLHSLKCWCLVNFCIRCLVFCCVSFSNKIAWSNIPEIHSDDV